MTVLRDIIDISLDGEWGHSSPADDAIEMSVVRGTDFEAVRVGKVDGVPTRFLDSRHAWRKRIVSNDIIFETAGGSRDRPTGRSLLVTPRRLSQFSKPVSCASFARFIRIFPEKAHAPYVFWLLQHLYNSRELLQFHTQHTGVARFQFTVFANSYQLSLPTRDTQERIASILCAYDELIEVNARRIKVLEEIAERTFTEWFTNLRFPGYEQTLRKQTTLGLIPEGWEITTVQEAWDTVGGGTPSKAASAYWEGGTINWYTPTDLTKSGTSFIDSSTKKITSLGLSESSARLFPAHSVMMTSRATLGVIAINTSEATTNQGFIRELYTSLTQYKI